MNQIYVYIFIFERQQLSRILWTITKDDENEVERVRDIIHQKKNESKEQVETWLILISIDRYVTNSILSEFM